MEENQNHIEDNQLWQRIIQNDPSAISILYKRHFQVLYSFGFKISQDEELSKDSIHDVFIYLWEHRENLHDVRNVRSYLLKSVKNRALKSLNKQIRTIHIDNHEDFPVELVFSEESYMIKNQEDVKLKERLNEAISQLTKRQKELIYLYYYEGMTPMEIQEVTSLQYQSVKNHIFKALSTIRKVFNKK